MKMMNLFKLSVLGLTLVFFNCQENTIEEAKTVETLRKLNKTGIKKKVLVVGFDGMQLEKISETSTPNLDKLTIVKAYTGGIAGTPSEQKTKSGPSWVTILTGVWLNKHGVVDNNSSQKSNSKSVFQLIKESNTGLKTASVVTWAPIHDFFRDQLGFIDYHSKSGGDENTVLGAIHAINNENSDFVFVHLDDVDVVGHSSGFGTSYNKAITRADEQFGRIVAEVEKRTNEDWLIMVVTDHGREPSGYGHGNQTLGEKTIFVGMNKSGNEEFSRHVNTPNSDFSGIYGNVAQTAIVPSVLTHLDIPIQKEWQLNSTSLVGSLGVRKVMMQNHNTLYWNSTSTNTVKIYRNNILIATVPASQGGYTDTNAGEGMLNYTLVLNGQSGSVALNNSKIIAGLDWNDLINNKAYFFRSDNKYVRYNKTLDKVDSGYPYETNNSSWSGLGNYRDLISAAFKWHNHKGYFFLNDGRYLRYDMNNDSVDSGYPTTITNGNWPGLEPYKNMIVAAINWNNSKAYFFLNDGRFIRYSISSDRVDSGYPTTITNGNWPGLGDYKTMITAAVDWNTTHCYFFLKNNTYIKYNKLTNSAVSGYPKPINNNTLSGLNN
ncbi:hemopexin repeat-containing protein [Pseudotenacibaculum haliotis]|uniref:Hemopexin repeat-containing protein n=1 Tax=Pseudotenacibaculum haliotis TaxID=1862138 RepID=A0ABW5LRI2_9FLAO